MSRTTALNLVRLGPTSAAAAFGVAWLTLSSPGLASPSFPGAMQEYMIATGEAPVCPPTCTLCHASPSGGVETVRVVGFTENLRSQSAVAFNARMRMPPAALTAGDVTSVGPAMDALQKLGCAATMAATPCDSDGDGMGDMLELRAGRNPDGPGELGECPQYGCGASVAPSTARPREVQGGWLFAALGVLVLVRRRR